ncbi:hypothetical protein CR513_43807, partial [Mucuna pruriens]
MTCRPKRCQKWHSWMNFLGMSCKDFVKLGMFDFRGLRNRYNIRKEAVVKDTTLAHKDVREKVQASMSMDKTSSSYGHKRKEPTFMAEGPSTDWAEVNNLAKDLKEAELAIITELAVIALELDMATLSIHKDLRNEALVDLDKLSQDEN